MPHAMTLWLAADTETAVEHAEAMALNALPAITAMVVFLLAFGFLYLKVWPKILKGLDDRDQKIRQEIANAEAAREQANAALAKYEKELASARQEANELITQARADAKAVAMDLRDRNEAHLVEMKQRATRDLEGAKRAAITELHAEAASLATDIASRILKREISATDQQRLVDESLGELAGARDSS
ncbi:MAG: F0F1 ATP synthase subunit B [Phycisphaerales bacterium]